MLAVNIEIEKSKSHAWLTLNVNKLFSIDFSGMLISILLQCLLLSLTYSISSHPILLVVSYDAFRYDYFESKPVPQMNRIRKLGAYADYLINIFPTKTFPNHYTIATGLYAESHGVIDNSYYDDRKQKVVGISYEMFHYNDNIIPIWKQNEDAGNGRYSGVMMWPGGCYAYQTKNVTHCQDYDHNLDWYQRVDIVRMMCHLFLVACFNPQKFYYFKIYF